METMTTPTKTTTPLRAELHAAQEDLARAREAATEAEAAYDDLTPEEADAPATRVEAAEARVEAARDALRESSEPQVWSLRDDGGCEIEVGPCSAQEARERAREWAQEGDYGDSDERRLTIWVDVRLESESGAEDSVTVQIDPDEPRCDDERGHDWQRPHELVGGIPENPGVWGHGGGVICTEACVRCGCRRTTDTWAQRRDTGAQGLTSVEYYEGAFGASDEG